MGIYRTVSGSKWLEEQIQVESHGFQGMINPENGRISGAMPLPFDAVGDDLRRYGEFMLALAKASESVHKTPMEHGFIRAIGATTVFYHIHTKTWFFVAVGADGEYLGAAERGSQRDMIQTAMAKHPSLPVHVYTAAGKLKQIISNESEVTA